MHTLCKDIDVHTASSQLEDSIKRLDCKPQSKLSREQQIWRRQQNTCNYQENAKQCMLQELAARTNYIQSSASCEGIKAPFFYKFPDPWIINDNPRIYEEKIVGVFGSVKPTSCDPGSSEKTAVLTGENQNNESLPVVFEELSAGHRTFLCEKQPISYWNGRIKELGGKPTLLLQDVLGMPQK